MIELLAANEKDRAVWKTIVDMNDKARAVAVDDVPENQRIDLALLLSLVGDVAPLQEELRRTEKSWLRRRGEMGNASTACWRFFSRDEAQRGVATFRQLDRMSGCAGWDDD